MEGNKLNDLKKPKKSSKKSYSCRICFTKIKSKRDKIHLTSEMKNKIEFCTKLSLVVDERAPKYMCVPCNDLLTSSYNFIMKCILSEETLLSNLTKVEVDEIKLENVKCETDMPVEFLENIKTEDEAENFPNDDNYFDLEDNCNLLQELAPLSHTKSRKSKKAKRKYKKRERVKKALEYLYCKLCGQKCTSPSALSIHMYAHSDEKPFQCNSCEKSYKSKYSLMMHIKNNHNKLKPPRNELICDYCKKVFHRRTNLIVHLRTHTGERPHKCTFCPLSFTQWSSMLRHKRTHTDERPFTCNTCGKSYRDSNTLKIHIATHSDERNFACGECGMAFKAKRTLRAHLLLHENGQKYICDKCGQSFNTKGNLSIHTKRVHSDRSGTCKICNKAVSDVFKHEIHHFGIFKCSTCNKKFNRPQNLKIHIKHSHTERTKYKCEVEDCRLAFSTYSKLEFHVMKFHTNETPFVCSECGRGFIRFCDLSKHLRVYHKYDTKQICEDAKVKELKKNKEIRFSAKHMKRFRFDSVQAIN